ncbi:MAG: hypothetical protein M3256_15575 [Actinomycetota bacterium]|nr:hypothetical protein [Actinomycetota bacterium]
MAFFTPPPPRPPWEPPQPLLREWDEPDDSLGREVPLQFVIARSHAAIVAVRRITAYHNGFAFDVSVRLLPGHELSDPSDFVGVQALRRTDGGLPDELFRFGLEFANGATVTSLEVAGTGGPTRPTTPILAGGGGGGGDGRFDMRYWVWPLPPPGKLTFLSEWPAHGLPLTRCEIDSEPIRTAAGGPV